MEFERDLPYSAEAEAAVIGSVLIDSECLNEILSIVKKSDFYIEKNKTVFEAINNLYNLNKPIDVMTVGEELKKDGIFDRIGGVAYLQELIETVPSVVNAAEYAKSVSDKAYLRKTIGICDEIQDECYKYHDAKEITEYAVQKVFDLVSARESSGVVHIKDILYKNYTNLAEKLERKGEVSGVSTGFKMLDKYTSGLQPSTLVLVAARPAMGKTSFAINIAQNIAIKQKKPVLIFSLEMSKEELVNRIISSEARIESNKIRSGEVEQEDLNNFLSVMAPLSATPIYIDDTASISMTEIRAKAKRLKMKEDLGLIVIDYLQLMNEKSRSESRQVEIAAISRGLKILAKELEIPIIAVSQLGRGPDKRDDHKPVISDLRESGAIEQDADMVLLLYRDEYYNPETTEKHNIGECIIAKHRAGETGSFEMTWLGKYTSFYDLETKYDV